MPVERHKTDVAAHPVTSAAIAILIAAAIFFILYTPVYSSITPKIGSWPLFYFYMLAYMPVTSLVLWIVTRLQQRLGKSGARSHGPETVVDGGGPVR